MDSFTVRCAGFTNSTPRKAPHQTRDLTMPYPLAAIRFEKEGNIDALLKDVITALRMRGLSLTGVVQTRSQARGQPWSQG